AISTAVHDNVPAKSEMAALFASVRSEIAVLRMEVASNQRDNKADFTAIRSEMRLLEHRMTIKLGAMLAAFAGILIAAMRFLIH
ncbi:hypothetical protein, partial [Escherichia coli]|uniref:hypothetical protein n=1 Tax=Escherichia coli TaxID=562 RepID=UPI001F44D033